MPRHKLTDAFLRNVKSPAEAQVEYWDTLTPGFGLRVSYFNRLESVVPEALNWVPSSTVAEVCFRGIKAVRRAALSGILEKMRTRRASYFIFTGCRLQVHDSAIFMFPIANWPDYAIKIRDILHSIIVPYDKDPLIIPWSIKASTRSWADATEIDWTSLELAA